MQKNQENETHSKTYVYKSQNHKYQKHFTELITKHMSLFCLNK